jgi:hypothetical protein
VKFRRPVLASTLLAAALGLAACSGTSPIASSPAAASGATSPAAASGATSSATQTTVPSATSTPTKPAGSVQASAGCSYIDQTTAASVLGFTTAAGLHSTAGSSAAMKKLDGCMYESATDGSLGYDVAQVDPQIAQGMVDAAKADMASAPVASYDVGLPNSIGFTQTLPQGVDSQVTIASGDRLIMVASTRKDGDVAKSQASAIAAAKLLVSHP